MIEKKFEALTVRFVKMMRMLRNHSNMLNRVSWTEGATRNGNAGVAVISDLVGSSTAGQKIPERSGAWRRATR